MISNFQERARYFVDRAYSLLCIAKGKDSPDAALLDKYRRDPAAYLADNNLTLKVPGSSSSSGRRSVNSSGGSSSGERSPMPS